jgi:uncharacterized membrane protein
MSTRTISTTRSAARVRPTSVLGWLDRHARLLLIVVIAGYVGLVSLAAIIKYERYLMGFDLALIQQVLWNTLNGRPFETLAYDFTTNILGTDSFLVLLVLLPLYALWPEPHALLIGQTLIVGTSAIPVYLLARDILKQRWAALAFATVYLLYLPVFNGNLYEIRERVLAMAFQLWILLCIHRRAYGWMIVPMILALSCRLDTTIGVALLGVYALGLRWLPQRDVDGSPQPDRIGWRFGVTLLLSAIVWNLFVTRVMIPSLTDRPGYLFAEHYAHLGDTPGAIVGSVLLNPLATIRLIATPLRFWYLLGMFLPLAFLPLLNWRLLLIMLPLYGLNLLSNRQAQWDVYHHYQGQIVPLMVLAAIFGLALLARRRVLGAYTLHWGVGAIVVATILSHALFGNQVVSLLKRIEPGPREAAADAIVAAVPDDAAVATGNVLASHLEPRRGLYLVPGDNFYYAAKPFDEAAYAIVDLDQDGERAALAAAIGDGGWCLVATSRDVDRAQDAIAAQQADTPADREFTADYVLIKKQPGANGERCGNQP